MTTDWETTKKTLHQRLRISQAQHRGLFRGISASQKVAAGQLQILFNIIAQQDARENLRQAAVSTEIARITREDGFAMRTIAVMTVAFLPATAVSSLFSMGVFDWQADVAATVVTTRFWIYWATVVPLTLLVLGAWAAWIFAHKQRKRRVQSKEDTGAPTPVGRSQGEPEDKTRMQSKESPLRARLARRLHNTRAAAAVATEDKERSTV